MLSSTCMLQLFIRGVTRLSKKIVVLGAGYAGILVAKKLAKKLKGPNVEISIIDRNPFHTMLTELHEVAAWRVDESSIRIELKKIFAGRKVNVVLDNIVETDYENKVLTGQAATYEYDYLVLATGCKPTFFGVKGAQENSFTLWSYDDAVRLREHIMNMFRLASKETDPNLKKSYLTFYVIGAGFTGVEMIGELAELVPILCEKFKIDPQLVNLHNVDVADRVMTIFPEKISAKASRRLEKMNVKLSMKTNVVGVNPGSLEYVVDGKQQTDTTHTVIWTAGTEGSEIAQQSEELGLVERTRGRIQTDKYLRSLNYPNVYVGGDNIFYIPEGEKRAVPQMVENCEHSAKVVATNIATEVLGGKPTMDYKPSFHGAMVCIGGYYGVAHVGLPNMMFNLPSFFAMLSKHFINMIYFLQVLGWNKVYSYIYNEFFTIRNRRSFVGGHFSNRTPVFWIVPLRVYLGIHWLFIAYRRFMYDWFTEPMYAAYFSNHVRGFRPNIFDINFFDHIHFRTFVANDEMHLWLQTSIVSWFLDITMFASTSTEVFFQVIIVLVQFGIGLALITGLFTTLASIVSLLFTLLIMLTIGLPMHLWWVVFASVGMLFTGGKVLALDYYVIPWLNKRWKNIPFVKKWYLYND